MSDTENQEAQSRPSSSPSVGAMTDVGMQRELNEDNLRWAKLNDDVTVFAVADGMGGHESGEVASQLAVQHLFSTATRLINDNPDHEWSHEEIDSLLREAFRDGNNSVVDMARSRESNMGTTMTVGLLYKGNQLFVANVGDSRCYVLRDSRLNLVSQDHSLVAYLVQMGEITSEQARVHPSGNILVRSVGSVQDVEVDLFHLPVFEGDRLLLCSDGLWGEVPDKLLEETLNEKEEPEECCRELIRLANEAGGKDNITCIVVNI
jgi:protein phosphatase